MSSWAERDKELLQDLLEHGQEALDYLAGIGFEDFQNDRRLQLVTERLMEIIGEAAGHLSDEAREAIPYDWHAVRGLRNILSHQYGNVDPAVLFAASTNQLPDLLKRIEAVLTEQSRQ